MRTKGQGKTAVLPLKESGHEKVKKVQKISEPRANSLNFIQSMLMQLTQMAKKDNFDVLAYLIDMAYIECTETIKNGELQDNKPSVDQKKRHSAA